MKQDNVIYDERIPRLKENPKQEKSNKRFIILVLLFFLLIIAIIYFQSPLSKLSHVQINGNEILNEEQLLNQAKLGIGMSYFNFSKTNIKKRLEEMIEVEEVEVERVLPNKLNITVQEYPIVSFWLEDNQLYPVISSGYILMNRPWKLQRVNHPILNEWPNKDGLIELSRELNKLSLFVRSRISEIRLTPIVSDPYRLAVYMIDGYEVRTSIRNFAENMSWYPHYVELARLEGEEEGIFYLLDGKWYVNPTRQDKNEPDVEGVH